MITFLNLFRSTIGKLQKDEHCIEDRLSAIKSTTIEISKSNEKLLKFLWVFHNHRTHIFFSRHLIRDRLSFVKGKPLEDANSVLLSRLLRSLQQDPSILAQLLHFARSEVSVIERICFLTYTAFGNCGLEQKDLNYLHSFTDCLLKLSSTTTHTTNSPVDNLAFVCVFKVLYTNLSCVRRYLTTLFHDLLSTIDPFFDIPDIISSPLGASFSLDEINGLVCGIGEIHPTDQMCILVNRLITRFQQTFPLFPGSILLLLGKYRAQLTFSGVSEGIKHLRSVELIVDLFIIQAMLHPLSYGASFKQHSQPHSRFMWLQTASAFRYLAHSSRLQIPPAKSSLDSVSKDDNTFSSKLTEKCDVKSLHSVLNQIIRNADLTLSKFQRDVSDHPGSMSSTDSASANLPNVILATATDLNILLDCLRLLRTANPEVTRSLGEMLDGLPSRIPGASYGVCQIKLQYVSSGPAAAGPSTDDHRVFKLVQYGPQGKLTPTSSKVSFKVLVKNERSHSTSRVTRARGDSLSNQSNSLDRVDRVPSRNDSPLQPSDDSYDDSTELVYIIPLEDYQRQTHAMSEADFFKSLSTDAAFSQSESKGMSNNPSNGSSHSRSSPDLSVEDSVEYKHLHRANAKAPVNTEANLQTRSLPSQDIIATDLLDTSDLVNEDNSEDSHSSDLSDRSGCTSLASSAHAMGRRLRFLTRPTECNRLSEGDQGSQQHSSEATVGKNTHISSSEFPIEAQTNPATGTDPLVDQLSFDTDLTNRCLTSNVLHRAPLVRTSSAEWPRHTGVDGLPHSSRPDREQLDVNRNGDTESPNSSRRSSLNSLQTSGFDAASNGSSRVHRDESEDLHGEIPGLPDRDELCSLHTCSSCGVCMERPENLGTRTASSSNLDFESHANLDTSRLDEEDEASSDLPLSSANVSGRITPLSLTSSTSRGPVSSTGNPNQELGFSRTGIVLPNGAVGSTILHCSATPDVTEKFKKFELPPPTRPPEIETRSTISDTWSTDVLPSDTEYTDLGSELTASETHVRHHNASHRHRSRRHGAHVPHTHRIEAVSRASDHEDRVDTVQGAASTAENELIVRTNTLEPRNASSKLEVEPSVEPAESPTASAVPLPCNAGGSLQLILTEDSPSKLASPSITPMGRDGSVVAQGHVASETKNNYTRIKDILSGRHRRSIRTPNSTAPQSHFPWQSKDHSARMGNHVVVADRRQRELDAQSNCLQSVPVVTEVSSGLLSRSASFTSTNSAPNLNVGNTAKSLNASSGADEARVTEAADLMTSESVEEMLDRYRRQSIRAGNPTTQPKLQHSYAPPQSVNPLSFEQLKRALYQLFCHPLVGAVFEEVVSELRMAWSSSDLSTDNSSNLGTQDRLLIAVLDSLSLECMSYEDIRLTTRIKEVNQLFRSLLDFRCRLADTPSLLNNDDSISPGGRSMAEHLLTEMLRDRCKRKAYLAYVSSIKTRLSRTLRRLKFLNNRWERALHLQCEDVIFSTIASLVDSQTECVDEFLRHFAENRLQNETDDGKDPAALLVKDFVDVLNHRWNAKYPASSTQLIQLPTDDVDFAPLISRISSPRSQIENLVLETLYRSGVWMHDAKVERQCDRLLYREISLYKNSVSMSSLRIPPAFQTLYPFVSIQDELRSFDSSHVPSDMIACLKRVVERIVATLTIVSPQMVPSADEILPLLIYILIQANPPRLLANSTFFETFHDPLEGEDEYVWCQFRAAVCEVRRLISRSPSNHETQSS